MATTPLTEEAKRWVEDKLTGRYGIVPETSLTNLGNTLTTFMFGDVIYFEDPKELMFYELYWSGK